LFSQTLGSVVLLTLLASGKLFMGHQHLGRLPSSREWCHVIDMISGGSDVNAIAAATSAAAERQMADASNDRAVKHAVWLLTQIPAAARKDDFTSELRTLGLEVSKQPTLMEVGSAMTQAIDCCVGRNRGRSDLGEMAQFSAVESLIAVAGRALPDLFGPATEKTKSALAGLGTVKQFAVLARDFFSRLARRQLAYFLSRELSNHVGANSRFHSIREHQEFEGALDLHCREASRIIKEFSGRWYSKRMYEGGIDEAAAGRFAHVAFGKLRDELRYRRGIDD
jgi:hypothetical protein